MKQGQTTTPGTPCPTLCEKCVGSLTSPANQYREDAGDGTYGLSSLSEKTRTSNRLRMSLQRQHILLSYFKTLSVGPVWGSNPRPPARQSGALPTELTRRRSLSCVMTSSFSGRTPPQEDSFKKRNAELNCPSITSLANTFDLSGRSDLFRFPIRP